MGSTPNKFPEGDLNAGRSGTCIRNRLKSTPGLSTRWPSIRRIRDAGPTSFHQEDIPTAALVSVRRQSTSVYKPLGSTPRSATSEQPIYQSAHTHSSTLERRPDKPKVGTSNSLHSTQHSTLGCPQYLAAMPWSYSTAASISAACPLSHAASESRTTRPVF
jgi:hypothetical protein